MDKNEREINLHGLTPEEVQMLDMMWSIETVEDMEDWVASLNREERRMVYRLRMLLIAEIIPSGSPIATVRMIAATDNSTVYGK